MQFTRSMPKLNTINITLPSFHMVLFILFQIWASPIIFKNSRALLQYTGHTTLSTVYPFWHLQADTSSHQQEPQSSDVKQHRKRGTTSQSASGDNNINVHHSDPGRCAEKQDARATYTNTLTHTSAHAQQSTSPESCLPVCARRCDQPQATGGSLIATQSCSWKLPFMMLSSHSWA